MADHAPTSRKVPPLAIIVVVILVALAVVAFANMRGQTTPPRPGPSAPQDRPTTAPVMPQLSTVPNAQQPASEEKGASGHRNTTDEPGGPATTANVTGTSR